MGEFKLLHRHAEWYRVGASQAAHRGILKPNDLPEGMDMPTGRLR